MSAAMGRDGTNGTRSVCAAVGHAGLWRQPVECALPPGHAGGHLANLGAGFTWSQAVTR